MLSTFGETITSSISNNTLIQTDAVGFKGFSTKEFSEVKSLGQAGSPTFTANTSLTTQYGTTLNLTGTITKSSSSQDITGTLTSFQSELRREILLNFLILVIQLERRQLIGVVSNTELRITATSAVKQLQKLKPVLLQLEREQNYKVQIKIFLSLNYLMKKLKL